MDKNSLRKLLKIRRAQIADKPSKDKLIFEKLKQLIPLQANQTNQTKTDKNKFCIFSYISMGSEVDTKSLLSYYISINFKVLVPVTSDIMHTVQVNKTDDLSSPDKFGNIAALKSRELCFDTPNVVIVPMLGFNKNLYRIGYGGGFYDRYLSDKNSLKIGLSYDEQETEEFNEDYFDVPMDIIITPSRIIGNID